MDNHFNVETFLRSIRATKAPWECPKCKKIYRSYTGMEYHLLNFDHTAPPPLVNKPTPIFKKSKLKFTQRKKHSRLNQRSSSPLQFKTPTRDTLTWAEAQRMVEVEAEGKVYRLNISDQLDIISDSDIDGTKSSEGNSTDKSEDESNCNSKTSSKKKTKSNKPLFKSNSNENVPIKNELNCGSSSESKPSKENKASTCTPTSTNAISKLPKASFRILSEYDDETSDAPDRSLAYYRFIEKPLEELEEEVEYDMDEEDAVWLELMNEYRTKEGLSAVSHNQLELLMDRFEKESYFEQAKNGSSTQSTQPLIDEDAVCCVCNDGECQNSNVILFCDMCNLAVHQECYGVPYIPEGQWLCRRCLQSPSCPVDCCLCPSRSGAFKQTDDGRWSHVVCALWVPEVGFGNTVFLEPIDGLKNIPPARWRLTCYVCKQRNVGACIQCHRTNCYVAFHVTCAQQAGLYMKMEPVRESGRNGVTITVKKEAYCDTHTPLNASPRQNRNNGQLVFESDDKKTTDKMKKTRKILAEKRHEMPHIAIPHIPRDKISSIGRHLNIQKKSMFLQRLLSYWTLKRQSRNGVPLLRRLQSHVHNHKPRDPEAESQQQHLIEQLKYWHRLRHDLERARLLIELLRKREKFKREAVRISAIISEVQLTPFVLLLRRLLSKLQAIDVAKVFAEPVSHTEAPDYHKIISNPMDFSTMSTKIENHLYKTIDEFEEDFNLVINNCILYNARDTIFYRLAVKMRDHGGAVLREAKREVERTGFDEGGLLLQKTPQSKAREIIDERKRLSLPAEQQLHVMYERLDQAILASRKTRKIRTEISALKRKICQQNKKESLGIPVLPDIKNAKENTRRFSADDAASSTPVAENEAVVSDVGSSFKVSPKIRPVTIKRSRGGRKRLWSARSSLRESFEPKNKKKLLERSDSCPVTNDKLSEDRPVVFERLSPEKCKSFLSEDEDNLIENVSSSSDVSPTKNSEKSQTSSPPHSPSSINESVNRRTAVLFKKKQRSRQHNMCQSGSEAHLPTHESERSTQSTSAPPSVFLHPTCTIKRTRSMSGQLSETDKDSSDTEGNKETKEALVNGVTSSQGELENVFKENHMLKPSPSFQNYREDMLDRESTSGSETATSAESSNESNTVVERRNRKRKKRSHSLGFANCHAYQSDVASSETSNDDRPGLILGDVTAAPGDLFRKQSYVSTTEDELEDDSLPHIKSLDLVWAKCRGYPPYPALLIDPNMPRSGFCHNGVPIPVPPLDVLQVGEKRAENGNHRIYLVLFFDTKRTWQWLPRNKLELLGTDTKSDQAKLQEGRRPALRKNVEAAYKRALLHRSRVTGEIPDSDDEVKHEFTFKESDIRD